MATAKYQLNDFLALLSDNTVSKNFVDTIHTTLQQDGYKPKIQVTKSTGLQISYHQPKSKTVAGIVLIFYVRENALKARINCKSHKNYHDIIANLPAGMISQVDSTANCVKFTDPQKCWKGCIGYEFHIGEQHYQKCAIDCFEFEVEEESLPAITNLIYAENKERAAMILA